MAEDRNRKSVSERKLKAMKARLSSMFQSASKAKTWTSPTKLTYLVIGSIIGVLFSWLTKIVEFKTGEFYSSQRLSAEIQSIRELTSPLALEAYARTNQISFSINLDGDVFKQYRTVEIIVQNSGNSAIKEVSFELSSGSDGTMFLALASTTVLPPNKVFPVTHNLPVETWVASTQEESVTLKSDGEPVSQNAFVSIDGNRGFGRATIAPSQGGASLRFFTNTFPQSYFVRVSYATFGGIYSGSEGDAVVIFGGEPNQLSDSLEVPNPMFFRGNLFNDSQNSKTEISITPVTRPDKVRVSFPSGIGKGGVVKLFALFKSLPGYYFEPEIKILGGPEIQFTKKSHVKPTRARAYRSLPLDRIQAMPRYSDAIATKDGILIFWDASDVSGLSGVSIYRSPMRAFVTSEMWLHKYIKEWARVGQLR